MASTTVTSTNTGDRKVGQVKWFNNKAGYGFITVNNDDSANNDIFVHYSSIRVTKSQYLYLVQGEYVEFSLVKSSTDKHEYQANDVSGINGGALMCETRNNFQKLDSANDSSKPRGTDRPLRKTQYSLGQNRRPRDESNGAESKDFTAIRRRPQQPKKRKEPEQSVSL